MIRGDAETSTAELAGLAAPSVLGLLAVAAVSAAPGGAGTTGPPAGTVRAPAAPQADTTEALRRGRRLTAWLHEGPADSVAAALDTAFLRRLGGAAGVQAFGRKVDRELGSEREVVAEEAFTDRVVDHYYRVSRFSRIPSRTVTTHWAWRDDGRVVGMRVRPTPRPAETENGAYVTRTRLRLPFEGRWYVAWGGRAPRRNHHARAEDQRFAYDFLVLEDGSSHAGDGRENADYHCFGRPVRAPAPGRVVRALDSVPDNTPGRMSRRSIFGNHVVLDHGHGEHSVLAHLRRGSVAVGPGDRVERGDVVGECGNSGHSSEPHLHYHLQDGPVPGEGTGLPAFFRGYRADGERVEEGEPVRGQSVAPVTAPTRR